jgi:4-azaleucine resistance transporter AzlC
MTTREEALTDGFNAIAPMLLALVPFGLVLGVTAAGSVVGAGWGLATSSIIFAGAAQLATVQLLDSGTALAVVILTALVINVRHLMYSAALAPHLRDFPPRWRIALPYLLTDQVFAVSVLRFGRIADAGYRRWFFLGAGLTLWVPWQLATLTGIVLGAQVPESLGLGFAVPLVFLVLLIPVVQTRPGLVAALVGGGVAVAAASAPYGLGLVIGAVAGIGAGVVAESVGRP